MPIYKNCVSVLQFSALQCTAQREHICVNHENKCYGKFLGAIGYKGKSMALKLSDIHSVWSIYYIPHSSKRLVNIMSNKVLQKSEEFISLNILKLMKQTFVQTNSNFYKNNKHFLLWYYIEGNSYNRFLGFQSAKKLEANSQYKTKKCLIVWLDFRSCVLLVMSSSCWFIEN